MRELRREIIDAFEMSQDLVMNTKEVNKEKTKSMVQQAQSEMKVQQAVQQMQQQQMQQQQPQQPQDPMAALM
jgi:cytidylate kinase